MCMVNLLVIPQKIVFFLFHDGLVLDVSEVLFCQATIKIKMSPLSVHS